MARALKIREAGIADEPMDTVFIDYVSGGTFPKDSLKNIVKLFGTYIRLAALHAPNGMPVFLNSDGVASMLDHVRNALKGRKLEDSTIKNMLKPSYLSKLKARIARGSKPWYRR
jgi:hypothetical protein